MGFAKTGIAIDQKGVIILGRMLCHGHGSGVGELVGRSHDKGLEGEFSGGKAVGFFLRRAALKLLKTGIIQKLDLKISGEDIVQSGLDVGKKEGFNIALLEFVGTVEEAGIPPDIDDGQLIEPGRDGRFRKSAPELAEDVLPDIGDGIQQQTPLLLKII